MSLSEDLPIVVTSSLRVKDSPLIGPPIIYNFFKIALRVFEENYAQSILYQHYRKKRNILMQAYGKKPKENLSLHYVILFNSV